MANLSESSHPYQREESISLNNSGDFSAVTQNLLVTRLGNVVNISSDRKLAIRDTTTVTNTPLEASNAANGDKFGYRCDLSGDGTRLAVTAIFEDGPANGQANTGAIYVFDHNGTSWVESAILRSSDLESQKWVGFGLSISEDGNTIVGGARTSSSNTGSLHIWRYNGASWVEEPKFVGSAGDYFGEDVGVSSDGEWVVVGAPEFGGGNGYVNVYKYNGAAYVLDQTIVGEASGDAFGIRADMAQSGNRLIVGAYTATVSGQSQAGAAYVYDFDGADWNLNQKLTASDVATAGTAWFGVSLAISGDGTTALVGALGDDSVASNAGSAYVFRYNGASWIEQSKLQFSSNVNDYFADNLAISKNGNKLIIGSVNDDSLAADVGAAYVYVYDGVSSWVLDPTVTETAQIGQLLPDDVNDGNYGRGVAMSNDGRVAVVGSEFGEISTSNAGMVNVYELSVSPIAGEWHSPLGLIPSWARPSTTQTTDGGPRNVYAVLETAGGTADDDLVCGCWVKADGTFVLQLTVVSSGDDATTSSPLPTSSVVPVHISYVIV